MPLRRYQIDVQQKVYGAWGEQKKAVVPVLPTGGGKTKMFCDTIQNYPGASVAIAHRQELVSQISLALAGYGVRHNIIGAKETRKTIERLHMDELGRSYLNSQSHCSVAGVDTLIKMNPHDSWFNRVGVGVIDEGHHVLRENKWGAAARMFPNSYWMLPTATALRADGKGLGRDADGIAETIVEGPNARELINSGFLTDYRVIGVPSDIDYSQIPVTASGDLSPPKLRAAVHGSDEIVGDIVKHYLKFAPGKLGITFAVDVESATDIAAAFRKAGVPAEVVTAKTPTLLRASILRQFKERKILQLVNVDLFGEGFDLPAIEVVSMARKTESFGLYVQMFGRALRLMIDDALMQRWDDFSVTERLAYIAASSKPSAIIIDHVQNVIRHGLPDGGRAWSLARRERRTRGSAPDGIPTRTCLNDACLSLYERTEPACPYCGLVPVVADRSAPEHVDGDLGEYSPELLKALRGEIDRIDGPATVPWGANQLAQMGAAKQHYVRQQAQAGLRANIALWAGYQKHLGRPDSETYRRFYFTFGTDIATAQTLSTADANDLNIRICSKLAIDGVVSKG
jgi:DNA repair protein RadD